jgi:hypothetical protein
MEAVSQGSTSGFDKAKAESFAGYTWAKGVNERTASIARSIGRIAISFDVFKFSKTFPG